MSDSPRSSDDAAEIVNEMNIEDDEDNGQGQGQGAQEAEGEVYIAYSSRWLMLATFSLCTLSNTSLWTSFAPTSTSSAIYFFGEGTADDISDSSKTLISMLALLFQILYPFGSLLSAMTTYNSGLRATVLRGSLLTAVGAFIRFLGVQYIDVGDTAYKVVFLGQSLCALGQPFFANIPGLLAANWFGLKERDTAVTIATLFIVVGNAYGQVLPPLMVTTADDGVTVNGMEALMLLQFIVAAAVCLICFFTFKSNAPTPPSESTAKRDRINDERRRLINVSSSSAELSLIDAASNNNNNNNISAANAAPGDSSLTAIKEELNIIFHDKQYLTLFVSFGFGLAIFNGLLTVSNEFLAPCGYSEDDAGNLAACLILAGLIGAGIAGFLMDKYHCYRELLKVGFAGAGIGSVIFCSQIYADNGTNLALAFAFLGFCMVPMLPVIIENSVECTYPHVSEEISAGVLFTAGNVIGVPVVFAMQGMINAQNGECGSFMSPLNLLIMITTLSCGPIVLTYQGEYKRLLQTSSNSNGNPGTEEGYVA
jgi:FLVCR family MFS transporter 7